MVKTKSQRPKGLFARQPGETALGSPKPCSQTHSPARDRTRWQENAGRRRMALRDRATQMQRQNSKAAICPEKEMPNLATSESSEDTARVSNPSAAECRFHWENAFKLRTYRRKSVNYFYGIFHGIFSVNHLLKAAFGCFI